MAQIDFSERLERLEAFEERLQIRLEGLYVVLDDEDNDITIRGELHPIEGTALRMNIGLVAVAYDSVGRVIKTDDHMFLMRKFFGFEVFSLYLSCPHVKVSKIRLYPKEL